MDDLQDMKVEIEDLVRQLRDTSASYEQSNRSDQAILDSVTELEKKLGDAQNRIDLAEEKASSADRVFVEAKESLGPVFTKDRLYSNQDFTFFFLIIAYIAFTTAIILSVEKKFFVLLGMLLVGAMGFLLIRRYA